MTSIVRGKYYRVYKKESTLKQFQMWGLKLGHPKLVRSNLNRTIAIGGLSINTTLELHDP